MTRDEILQMEAGREMDALVAEKVMEWKLQPVIEECYQYFKDETGKIRYIRNDPLPGLCWMPSRRISDAWEVVEKLIKIGWSMNIENSVKIWDFIIWIPKRSSIEFKKRIYSHASTFPLAVCRVALLAVEGL